MQKVLHALRRGEDLLLPTMELFVRDPIWDWAGAAGGQGADKEIAPLSAGDRRKNLTGSSTTQKEAFRKVGLARAKLQGANPRQVLLHDVETNPHVVRYGSFDGIRQAVEGQLGRARTRWCPSRGEKGKGGERGKGREMDMLTVAEQVEVLIDLATDPNVLMRQYVGLAPYM